MQVSRTASTAAMRSSSELGTGAATSLRSMSCRARTSPVSSSIFLILDPFVRLHRIDENASGEVAPPLAYLRELQRRYALGIVVVHHAKRGAGNVRTGQALRGYSEFHAWGDSNLYLRREADTLTLSVEHRAAPALPRPPCPSTSCKCRVRTATVYERLAALTNRPHHKVRRRRLPPC